MDKFRLELTEEQKEQVRRAIDHEQAEAVEFTYDELTERVSPRKFGAGGTKF